MATLLSKVSEIAQETPVETLAMIDELCES